MKWSRFLFVSLYKQTDGLAMGSPPAPHLANGWMSKFDPIIQGSAQLFTRYMDDILREIKRVEIDSNLAEINNLHPNLSFTIKKENEGTLPFLDMQLIRKDSQVSSTWYSKPTDTGLILNFHALAPKRYKTFCSIWLCAPYTQSMQQLETIPQQSTEGESNP